MADESARIYRCLSTEHQKEKEPRQYQLCLWCGSALCRPGSSTRVPVAVRCKAEVNNGVRWYGAFACPTAKGDSVDRAYFSGDISGTPAVEDEPFFARHFLGSPLHSLLLKRKIFFAMKIVWVGYKCTSLVLWKVMMGEKLLSRAGRVFSDQLVITFSFSSHPCEV